MKLSKKTIYAVQILIQLAVENSGDRVPHGRLLAKKLEISEPYLEQIMIILRNAGLVVAERGCNGGYRLNRRPEDTIILNVLELFEGKFNIVNESLKKRKYTNMERFLRENLWDRLSCVLRNCAASISLQDLIEKGLENSGSEYMI
jgi:Rrf2 family protein